MNYTENLSLGLPGYGESADVAALNRNSGILDAYCYNTRQIECEPYDSTKTYMSGDLSIHNEAIYECNTDNTTGTWDDSKWDSTTLAEQIAKAKQSGGGQVTKEASGNPIELTDAASAPIVKCVTQITGYQQGSGTPSPDNIRPIVAYTEGEIEVSDGDGNVTTHTTTYPSAIYRGSEDVVGSSVNSSHLRFTVSSGIELYGNYGDDNAPLFYVDMPEYIITYVRAGFSEDVPISNFYNATTGNSVASMHDFEFRTETPPSGTFAKRVYLRDSRFTTAADFNTFIATNPIQFVFKLATESTSSVTPTNLPIRTLSGYTHIESSTGDMEVEYITEEYQPLVDLIQISNGHTYSTQEQVVGKWIDGSAVYERVIEYATPFTIANDTWYTSTESYTGISKIVNAWIINADGAIYNGIIVLIQNDKLVIGNQTKTQPINNLKYVILRYTKTTATRSLSAPVTSQKAQIEPLTDKTEEVPTEEEKAVNEEENTNENR